MEERGEEERYSAEPLLPFGMTIGTDGSVFIAGSATAKALAAVGTNALNRTTVINTIRIGIPIHDLNANMVPPGVVCNQKRASDCMNKLFYGWLGAVKISP